VEQSTDLTGTSRPEREKRSCRDLMVRSGWAESEMDQCRKNLRPLVKEFKMLLASHEPPNA
jgi:hypothetical protein